MYESAVAAVKEMHRPAVLVFWITKCRPADFKICSHPLKKKKKNEWDEDWGCMLIVRELVTVVERSFGHV
jgi:hypothetical protein